LNPPVRAIEKSPTAHDENSNKNKNHGKHNGRWSFDQKKPNTKYITKRGCFLSVVTVA
jgi:hypothetical protein